MDEENTQQNPLIVASSTLAPCVELAWANGKRILVLPTVFLVSAEWRKDEDQETVWCDWGNWIITLVGYGIQDLAKELARAAIERIEEMPPNRVVPYDRVVSKILAVKKKEADDERPHH